MEKEEMNSEEPGDKAEDVAESGRGGDTVMAHLSLGELVIPRAFLDDPQIMGQMKALFEQAGANINQYIVGDEANSINPETGYPEFGFFKSFKKLFKVAAPLALSYFAPGIGTAIGGALGAGATFAPIVGGAALGAGTSALTGDNALKGAAFGGASGALSSALSGGLNNTALGRAVSGGPLGDIYKSASGAFNDISSGADSLYQGSGLQDAFKSGGDALKSIGIDTTSLSSSPAPVVGGGASSYGPQLENAANIPGFVRDSIGPQPLNVANMPNSAIKGATEVANNYASPLASALLGGYSNNQAEEALLKGQRANQALLAPYANGFSFSPGDLTQDLGYQFQLAEGTKAADRAQLARGGYFSGNAAKELAQFSQGLADNTYNTAFNRALQGNQAGLTGALANAGINTDIGNIKANSATNTGNLYSGALGAMLGGNSFTNTGALQGGTDIQALLRRLGIGNSAYAGA